MIYLQHLFSKFHYQLGSPWGGEPHQDPPLPCTAVCQLPDQLSDSFSYFCQCQSLSLRVRLSVQSEAVCIITCPCLMSDVTLWLQSLNCIWPCPEAMARGYAAIATELWSRPSTLLFWACYRLLLLICEKETASFFVRQVSWLLGITPHLTDYIGYLYFFLTAGTPELPVGSQSAMHPGQRELYPDLRQVTILPRADWERIQFQLNKRTIEEEKRRRAREEKERLHELSKERVKNWSNTVAVSCWIWCGEWMHYSAVCLHSSFVDPGPGCPHYNAEIRCEHLLCIGSETKEVRSPSTARRTRRRRPKVDRHWGRAVCSWRTKTSHRES